jgi:uncharacterized membrane protein YsdA (DUF1294 family)
MKKETFYIVSLLLTFALVLTGCGSKDPAELRKQIPELELKVLDITGGVYGLVLGSADPCRFKIAPEGVENTPVSFSGMFRSTPAVCFYSTTVFF